MNWHIYELLSALILLLGYDSLPLTFTCLHLIQTSFWSGPCSCICLCGHGGFDISTNDFVWNSTRRCIFAVQAGYHGSTRKKGNQARKATNQWLLLFDGYNRSYRETQSQWSLCDPVSGRHTLLDQHAFWILLCVYSLDLILLVTPFRSFWRHSYFIDI